MVLKKLILLHPILRTFAGLEIGKGIEQQTKVWNKIIDRRGELSEWAEILGKVHKRKIQILAFANNHYAGYGPGTIEQFRELWRRQVGETEKGNRSAKQGQLFK